MDGRTQTQRDGVSQPYSYWAQHVSSVIVNLFYWQFTDSFKESSEEG